MDDEKIKLELIVVDENQYLWFFGENVTYCVFKTKESFINAIETAKSWKENIKKMNNKHYIIYLDQNVTHHLLHDEFTLE